jgi:phosphoglycolate phosphatase-like HAD superfamily hydrolase
MLIEGGGVSRRAYAAAFRRATGRDLELDWQFDGRTGLAAASGVLSAHGIDPGDGRLERFLDLIVEELRLREGELASQGRVLPGAVEAIAAFGAVPGVYRSVLTGNLRAIALLKLSALRLDHHFDLRVGAYGDDAFERTDLPASAFDRTEKYLGYRHSGADTVIVGDTVRDVATARAAGARAIAVATGTVPEAELRAAGADIVLPDLTDTEAVVAAILGGR